MKDLDLEQVVYDTSLYFQAPQLNQPDLQAEPRNKMPFRKSRIVESHTKLGDYILMTKRSHFVILKVYMKLGLATRTKSFLI